MGWTLRPVDTRPQRAESGGGVLGRGSEPPPSQTRGLGSSVSSPSGVPGGALENLDFGALWDVRNHVRMVS